MIIDISSYNGRIDFEQMAKGENIERIILRGTTKNGQLDVRFMENINGICQHLDGKMPVDVYKFSYARNYGDAAAECYNLIATLKQKGVFNIINMIWLDLEDFDGRAHTTNECGLIISAYDTICRMFGVKFGIYCNYNYLKNILPKWTAAWPIWLARYNSQMGNVGDFNVVMWQYTSSGSCAGITGAVDISKYVKGGDI